MRCGRRAEVRSSAFDVFASTIGGEVMRVGLGPLTGGRDSAGESVVG